MGAKVSTSHQLTFRKEDIVNLSNKVVRQTSGILTNLDGVAKSPEAVLLIDTLTILAACINDCSLDHPQTKDFIKWLKIPGSFKASLIQVVYETTMAFVNAASSTSQMKMELTAIPNAMLDSIKAASQPEAKKILEVNKRLIDKAANFCADQAEGVAKQFEDVTNLIMELVEAATATQGLNEEQIKEIKKQIKEIEAQKKLAEDENERVQEEISKQERRTKEAREEYKEIIEYLSKELVIFDKLFSTWLQQVTFFRSVADTISGPLKQSLMEFIKYQNDATAIESAQSDMLKKTLLETAMKGCGICYQVMKCFEIYQEISTKHIMPKLAKATENLRLSKGDAQRQLLNTKNEYAETEEELFGFINLRKAEMMIKTENEISSHIKKLAIVE